MIDTIDNCLDLVNCKLGPRRYVVPEDSIGYLYGLTLSKTIASLYSFKTCIIFILLSATYYTLGYLSELKHEQEIELLCRARHRQVGSPL